MIATVQAIVGKPVTLSGYAQSFASAIAGVQLSGDNGATWTTFDTPGADMERNVNWSFTFTPEKTGAHRLLVRSINAEGCPSPEPAVVSVVASEA